MHPRRFTRFWGLNLEGRKEILGLYLSETEGANFWLSVLTDLNNRGLQDILIACVDGLTGFPEAINAIFPKAEVQLCVHRENDPPDPFLIRLTPPNPQFSEICGQQKPKGVHGRSEAGL